jgi:hypothetical protein
MLKKLQIQRYDHMLLNDARKNDFKQTSDPTSLNAAIMPLDDYDP